jgi:hypothetical protein
VTSYPICAQITLSVVFTTPAGVAVDPSEITLQIRSPARQTYTYKYSLAELTKDSVGHYSYVLTLDQASRWVYRFTGSGGYRGTTGDVPVNVDASQFSAV